MINGKRYFLLPNFNTPVPGMSREILDNDTATIDKIYLNSLEMKKGESGGVSILRKAGM